jgi:hypothetical protein
MQELFNIVHPGCDPPRVPARTPAAPVTLLVETGYSQSVPVVPFGYMCIPADVLSLSVHHSHHGSRTADVPVNTVHGYTLSVGPVKCLHIYSTFDDLAGRFIGLPKITFSRSSILMDWSRLFRKRALLKLMSLTSIRLFSACSASVHFTPGAHLLRGAVRPYTFVWHLKGSILRETRKEESESARSAAMALEDSSSDRLSV